MKIINGISFELISLETERAQSAGSHRTTQKSPRKLVRHLKEILFNPFQPAPRRQAAKKEYLLYFLLLHHTDTKNIFFKIKIFFCVQ